MLLALGRQVALGSWLLAPDSWLLALGSKVARIAVGVLRLGLGLGPESWGQLGVLGGGSFD